MMKLEMSPVGGDHLRNEVRWERCCCASVAEEAPGCPLQQTAAGPDRDCHTRSAIREVHHSDVVGFAGADTPDP